MKSNAAAEREFVEAIAEQVASCADEAVRRWMAEFDSVLQDPHLTTLGRLQAITAIVASYRHSRGGMNTECTQPRRPHGPGWGLC